VTTGTVEEMQWEILPHTVYSSDLALGDFHLFDPLKEALGGKIFRADDEVKMSAQRHVDEEMQTL
jgi:hypothetical protein